MNIHKADIMIENWINGNQSAVKTYLNRLTKIEAMQNVIYFHNELSQYDDYKGSNCTNSFYNMVQNIGL